MAAGGNTSEDVWNLHVVWHPGVAIAMGSVGCHAVKRFTLRGLHSAEVIAQRLTAVSPCDSCAVGMS